MEQNSIDITVKNENLINAVQNVANSDKSALCALRSKRFSLWSII